jgi:hypothetical protein
MHHFNPVVAAQIALAVVLFIAFAIMTFRAMYLSNAMLMAVNEKLPAGQKIALGPFKLLQRNRIYSEYRRLYPQGDLLRRTVFAYGCAAVLLFSMPFVPSLFR